MCKNCDNGNSDFKELDRVLAQLLGVEVPTPKSEEEQIRELMDSVDTTKAKVVKSVPIDSAVTVHFLPGYLEHGDSVIKLVTALQRNYRAPGKVDVFFPASDNQVYFLSSGPAQSQGATSRWSNGKPTFDGKDRVVFLDTIAFKDEKSESGWHMPVYDNDLVNEGQYVLTHEWGHVVDNRRMTKENAKQIENRMRSAGLIDWSGRPSYGFWRSLSDYGQENEMETYAECFAEWVVTNGQTDNFATKWYAKEYSWSIPSRSIHFTRRPV